MESIDQKPKLIRYLLEAKMQYITDCGHRPHLILLADAVDNNPVLKPYLDKGTVILNFGISAVGIVDYHRDYLQANMRFNGLATELFINYDHIMMVFDKETGFGVALPDLVKMVPDLARTEHKHADTPAKPNTRPKLSIVADNTKDSKND